MQRQRRRGLDEKQDDEDESDGRREALVAVGAASEKGADLGELLRIGQKVNSVTRTMGMALTSCTPPAKGSPLFELGDDEIEMGVGIHGEPGRRREKLAPANAIVDELLEAVDASYRAVLARLPRKDRPGSAEPEGPG